MTNAQKTGDFEFWSLGFIWNLSFVICDFFLESEELIANSLSLEFILVNPAPPGNKFPRPAASGLL